MPHDFPLNLLMYGRRMVQRRWNGSLLFVGLAVLALGLALAFPWVGVPLFGNLGSFDLPIDLGWGLRFGAVSYGMLTMLIALIISGRVALHRTWHIGETQVSARPIRPRTLVKFGALASVPALLFIYQFTLVDLGLVAHLADQENQSLLIRQNLGYTLAEQRLLFNPFQIPSATVGDRSVLLFQLAKPGLVLPLIAACLCLIGAWLLKHRSSRIPPAVATPAPSPPRIVWLAVGIIGIILLGRAPLGLYVNALGKQAITLGAYSTALQRFALAATLAPALDSQLAFHQARGAALVNQGKRANRDAGLYRASQFRALGSNDQASLEDHLLNTQYPQDALVTQDTALTLESQIEHDLATALSFNNVQRIQDFPLDSLQQVDQVLPALEQDLPHLDALLADQPTNGYAHFLRGRILLITRSYDRAALDFQATLTHTSDRDMRSASDTYLAFCLGGQGDFAGERRLLMTAMELDDGYYNTTAREAASGLH